MIDAVKLFASVLPEFHDHSKWDGAILGKIKTISNTKVGGVGQLFIERLCGQLSIPCSFPLNARGDRLAQSPWDIKINGIEFELKTATEDTNNHFQFNHIRYHRAYQALLCLGVSPNNLYFGIWSKADVVTGKAGNLVSMEKSANASYKLTKAPHQLHEIISFQAEIGRFARSFR
ncbi:MAG: hypothetical protein L7F77_14760 [Candidatus Magnetominusculus sp. LBB02]|nr:hypothetical protein [Candidatus Magnetominusculus sp. LBB02]